MLSKRIAVIAGAVAAVAGMVTAVPAGAAPGIMADHCNHHSAGWECYGEPSTIDGSVYLTYDNRGNWLSAGFFTGNYHVTIDYSVDNGRTWHYVQSGYSQSSFQPSDQHRLHRACVDTGRGWHCTPGRNSMP